MREYLRIGGILIALTSMGFVMPACSIMKCAVYSNRCN